MKAQTVMKTIAIGVVTTLVATYSINNVPFIADLVKKR